MKLFLPIILSILFAFTLAADDIIDYDGTEYQGASCSKGGYRVGCGEDGDKPLVNEKASPVAVIIICTVAGSILCLACGYFSWVKYKKWKANDRINEKR